MIAAKFAPAGLAAALFVCGAAHAELAGRVIAVHDGDTISILIEGRPLRVRLHGIDAPERGQAFGNAARHALESLVAGREVLVVERGRDGFGRLLGRVYVQGVDVNAEQVRSGYAWVFRRFGQDAWLFTLEAEAKAARRGLWRDPAPVAPWVWRDRRLLQPAHQARSRDARITTPTPPEGAQFAPRRSGASSRRGAPRSGDRRRPRVATRGRHSGQRTSLPVQRGRGPAARLECDCVVPAQAGIQCLFGR